MKVMFSLLLIISTLSPAHASDLVTDSCSDLLASSTHEGDSAKSLIQRIQLLVPARVRQWQRELVPASTKFQIDALHAELKSLLPESLAAELLSTPGYVFPSESRFEEPLGLKRWLINLNRAERILKEILQISVEMEGPGSEAAAMSHFSLSLYYYFSAYRQIAIQKTNENYAVGVGEDFNEYQSLAISHGHAAKEILYALSSPMAPIAHLHLIKQLVRSSYSLSHSNVAHMSTGKAVPADPKFDSTFKSAEEEIQILLERYMNQGLSAESASWVYVNTMLASYRLEGLRDTMSKRVRGDVMTVFGYAGDVVHDRNAYERATGVLQIAIADRKVLLRLLQEKGGGALASVVNNLRWANYPFRYHSYTYVSKALATKRNELLRSLEQSLRVGMTVDEFIDHIRKMEFDVPSYFIEIENSHID